MGVKITKDLQLRALSKGVHTITRGLQFKSNGDGTGGWMGRYSVGGKQVNMTLGTYPATKLSEVKLTHTQHQLDARNGINPKRQVQEAVQENVARGVTFRDILDDAHEHLKRNWRNGGKGYGFMSKMESVALPAIGDMPVSEIRAVDLRDMCRKDPRDTRWDDKFPTLDKALLYVGQVLQWAEEEYGADGGAARRARKMLGATLYEEKPQPSMPFEDVPAFYATLGDSPSDLAFRLLILTAVRPDNAATARYDQLEDDGTTWHLLPSDMKRKADHWVPLSDEAVRVLELAEAKAVLHREIGGLPKTHLFPSKDAYVTGHVSSNDWSQSMRRRELGFTAHGFRSSFKMWAMLNTEYDNALIEEVLHHRVRGAVEQAYIRGSLAELRRPLMQDWADFLTGKRGLTPISAKALEAARG